jgi:transcriptional regulator with XRE-family HTH domain
MSTLRERLIEAREAAGLSQEALATRAHCGQSTVASIERGRNKGATPLPMLAHILHVEALWLVEGKGPKRREDFHVLHDATEAALSASVVASIKPEDRDILAVSDLMRTMCASQRGEVLGYARRVAETNLAANKANAAP